VAAARDRQRHRFLALGRRDLRLNAEADGDVLEAIARPEDAALALLREAAERMGLSARGYHRVVRVARTAADLTGNEMITREDMAEALTYRQRLAAFEIAA
jgi:magnesium chelatase family protein